MYHNQFELFILVNGKKVREYYHDGKIFIEGKKGSEFTLKFKNNSYQRVLFVPSIDGLSVIDGKEASKNSGGYIVDALRSIEIKGWRTSLDDVASFIFDEKINSYVNKKSKNGNTMNCGVIGGRVFSEKTYYDYTITCSSTTTNPYWKYLPYTTCNAQSQSQTKTHNVNVKYLNAQLYDNMNMQSIYTTDRSPNPDFNLGTKFGQKQESKVEAKSFETDQILTELVIYYTDRQGLLKAGINIENKDKIYPTPFLDFCEPPKF